MGKYTTKYDTLKLHNKTWYTIPKERITVHKSLGNCPQYKKKQFGNGAEVIHDGLCLPTFHLTV